MRVKASITTYSMSGTSGTASKTTTGSGLAKVSSSSSKKTKAPRARVQTASQLRSATGGGDGGSGSLLGMPAVRLVLARLGLSDKEEDALVDKLAKSARNFDRRRRKKSDTASASGKSSTASASAASASRSSRRGKTSSAAIGGVGGEALTVEEYFNVIKLQNGIDIGKDELKTILNHLAKDREGRIKVSDFLHQDIHSKDVFQVFDRNKDGYITKGELKLAKKNFAIKDIDSAIKELDMDGDGKLNKKEFERSLAKKK